MQPYLTTKDLAARLGVQPTSIRVHTCLTGGAYFGIHPQKLPNGRLLWPSDAVERLLAQRPRNRQEG